MSPAALGSMPHSTQDSRATGVGTGGSWGSPRVGLGLVPAQLCLGRVLSPRKVREVNQPQAVTPSPGSAEAGSRGLFPSLCFKPSIFTLKDLFPS